MCVFHLLFMFVVFFFFSSSLFLLFVCVLFSSLSYSFCVIISLKNVVFFLFTRLNLDRGWWFEQFSFILHVYTDGYVQKIYRYLCLAWWNKKVFLSSDRQIWMTRSIVLANFYWTNCEKVQEGLMMSGNERERKCRCRLRKDKWI